MMEETRLSSVDLSYEDFREAFEHINNPRDAALIATVYCGYARIGEIGRGRYDKSPSIMRENINFTPSHMVLTIKTEKTKQWRRVPTSRELEDWLHEPIRNYLNYTEGNEVFSISTGWAEKRFKKWFGTLHIHLLRHWACTHCLQGKRTRKRLKIQDVQRLGGWIDAATPSRIYSHLVTEDLHELI